MNRVALKKKFPYLTDEVLDEYKEAYDHFDLNKNDKLSRNEVADMMKKLGYSGKKDTVDKLFEQFGKKDHFEIGFEEFIAIMREHKIAQNKQSTPEIISAFEVFDKEKKGYLSLVEFRYILIHFGNHFTDEEVTEIFQDADLNNDGRLEYEEFVNYWQEQ